MPKAFLGMTLLLLSGSSALADDACRELWSEYSGTWKVEGYICDNPKPKAAPVCRSWDKEHLLCPDPIGQPVPQETVVPRNWDRKHGRLFR